MANKSLLTPGLVRIWLVIALGTLPALTLAAQDAAPESAASVVESGSAGGLAPGRFLGDLGRNSVALVSKPNLVPLLLGAGSALTAHAADPAVRDYFLETSRLGPLEPVGDQLGRFLVVAGAAGGLMVAGELGGNEKFRRFTYDLGQAAALTGIVTGGLKVAAGRPRPHGTAHTSFPSGHTAGAFTVATVATHHYGLKAAIPGYLTATLVGVSRLDADQHFLSDVVAGAALGYIVARTVVRRSDEGRLAWMPVLSPGERTVGISVTLRLGRHD